jgi:hypothetical protein
MRQANPQKTQGSNLQTKPQGMLNKQSRPSSLESGPGRPIKAAPQQKPVGGMKLKQTREHIAFERKPTANQMDKSRLAAQSSTGARLELAKPKTNDDGLDNNRKLEAAKRRLQERYQEAENGSFFISTLSITLMWPLLNCLAVPYFHLCSQKAAHYTSNAAGRHSKA